VQGQARVQLQLRVSLPSCASPEFRSSRTAIRDEHTTTPAAVTPPASAGRLGGQKSRRVFLRIVQKIAIRRFDRAEDWPLLRMMMTRQLRSLAAAGLCLVIFIAGRLARVTSIVEPCVAF